MPPTTQELIAQVKDGVYEAKLVTGAVKQLEEQFAKMEREITQLKRTRLAAGNDGSYRGVFGDEHEARGFGLWALTALGNPSAAKALQTFDSGLHAKAMDSVGDGALIPHEFSDRLQALFESYGVFEAAAMTMPMGSESLSFIRQTGDPTVYVVGENTAATDSDPEFGQVTLQSKELATLTFVPRTLAEDSAAEIGEILARSIARAHAKALDRDGFLGDGSATYHGFTGIIPKLKSINGVDDGGGLVLASGNAWSEITLDDIDGLIAAVPQYAAGEDAAFYCSRRFWGGVMLKLAHEAGGVTAAEIEGERRMMWGGYPVVMTQVMPTAEGNSQVPLLFGDLSQAATVGRRRDVTIEESRDYKFAERQLSVLGTRRVAINVHDVGDATDAGPVVGLITASG